MQEYRVKQLAEVVEAKVVGDVEVVVDSVIIDSRTPATGNNPMFVAIKGPNHDGHDYIGELYNYQDINVFLISEVGDLPKLYPDATFIVVEDTLYALQQIAAFHRQNYKYPVIGITGSNGKTIVKEWLNQLLSPDYRVVRSPKSFNSQVGVPLSVLQMDESFELGIFEAGISQPGEMLNLEEVIKPTIGIFTNIGLAHQQSFDDLDEKVNEKLKLFKDSSVLIYCKDHELVDRVIAEDVTLDNVDLLTWGKHPNANVHVDEIVEVDEGKLIDITYKDEHLRISIPFTDSASYENAMHCVSLMLHLNVDREDLVSRITKLNPIAMRLELKEGIGGSVLINDSYNSDLGSLSIALDFMLQQKKSNEKVIILSDILQSGYSSELLYSKVAHLLEDKGINELIGIGHEITRFAHLFDLKKEFYPDTTTFLKTLKRERFADKVILVKGSRAFQFEKISAVLEQKSHRTIMEINLNALAHNLNFYRGKLKPGVKTMVMVKAFSYGSGAYEVANLLQFNRADYLGVAYTDEGVVLREAGISLPIIVLNPSFGTYELMVEYNLEPEIYNFEGLTDFIEVLKRNGENHYNIHIKLDTGMHRLGFSTEQLSKLVEMIKGTDTVKVKSMFSHLATSDEPDQDEFTLSQLTLFDKMTSQLSNSLGYNPIRHILNTGGIERFPDYQFDMVRLGIGLYGISTTAADSLRVVATLRSRIIQLKELKPGDTVGYSRRGVITRPSVVATIPVGYADGLNRRLGNGAGKFLVNGVLVPTIGNINMDTAVVDVTGVDVKVGDDIVIFGENPPITEIAKAIGTIPYEVLTSISRRVKRIYYNE